ncbi:MAG: helix-turn-helix transcriptional regulator [Ectothiorhodospiraceae bacterium]|nr:helix-turn-helix transcriptional regulator [Ectothiorhodospiraceae bacterium]
MLPRSESVAHGLTRREHEVLILVAKGYSRPTIASLLGLSPHTVTDHVKSTYRKLGVHSCAEAALAAARLGLVDPACV